MDTGNGRSLREIAEGEGKGQVLGGRELIGVLVHFSYREARQAMKDGLADMGIQGINIFMNQMQKLEKVLIADGDQLGGLMCRHNMASAIGFRDKREQNVINREVLVELDQLVDSKQVQASDPDVVFIRSKATFGLIENDPEFAEGYSPSDHFELVLAMKENRYPDFPGRALVLVQSLPPQRVNTVYMRLLHEAATCEFGKSDQRRDVIVELVERGQNTEGYLEALDDA